MLHDLHWNTLMHETLKKKNKRKIALLRNKMMEENASLHAVVLVLYRAFK